MSQPTPVKPELSNQAKLDLYRAVLIVLCNRNGGSIIMQQQNVFDLQGGTLMHRTLPDGSIEFKFVPDSATPVN